MPYRTIEASELRTADILVTTGRAFVSGTIRTTTGTDFSHTILYIGEGKIVEAISEGVIERALSTALGEANLAIALRRRGMDASTKQAVVKNACSFTGLGYDYTGAAGSGLAHNRAKAACIISPMGCATLYAAAKLNARESQRDKKFFCSELVARCFQLAGKPINDGDPSFTTPRSVRVASNLMYVGHLIGGP